MKKYVIKYLCQGRELSIEEIEDLPSPVELNSKLELKILSCGVSGVLFTQCYAEIFKNGGRILSQMYKPRPA